MIKIVILVAVVGGVLLFAYTRRMGLSSVMSMNPKDAHEMVKTGKAVLIDVREESELASGLAEGASWFATSKLADQAEWDKFVATLAKDKRVIFYCAAGVRAGRAADRLTQQGFETGNIGGFKDWIAADLPVQQRAQ